jgi:hypothetical protein
MTAHDEVLNYAEVPDLLSVPYSDNALRVTQNVLAHLQAALVRRGQIGLEEDLSAAVHEVRLYVQSVRSRG